MGILTESIQFNTLEFYFYNLYFLVENYFSETISLKRFYLIRFYDFILRRNEFAEMNSNGPRNDLRASRINRHIFSCKFPKP